MAILFHIQINTNTCIYIYTLRRHTHRTVRVHAVTFRRTQPNRRYRSRSRTQRNLSLVYFLFCQAASPLFRILSSLSITDINLFYTGFRCVQGFTAKSSLPSQLLIWVSGESSLNSPAFYSDPQAAWCTLRSGPHLYFLSLL